MYHPTIQVRRLVSIPAQRMPQPPRDPLTVNSKPDQQAFRTDMKRIIKTEEDELMTNKAPIFEKKGINYSGYIYTYLPVDLPVYAAEVTHRDPVNGRLLQKALEKTLKRMPYLSDTLVEENGKIYYAKNPLPMKAAHFKGLRRVGGEETNYHQLDVTWDKNTTWFSMYHGFTDGQGLDMFMESVLYHYYCLKDGVEYEPNGIRTEKDPILGTEEEDPYEHARELPLGFALPDLIPKVFGFHIPGITQVMENTVLDDEFRLPSEKFLAFVKEKGATPSIALSMLLGEAIHNVYPNADSHIVSIILMSIRKQLGCEGTFKNCTHFAVVPAAGTPLDPLPFEQRAAAMRMALDAQRNPNVCRAVHNGIGVETRRRVAESSDYAEEIMKPNMIGTACLDTFFMDYVGSIHQTDYMSQITDIRYLCTPASNNSLQMNVFEHNHEFKLDLLCCNDVTPIADAFEKVLNAYGLAYTRKPQTSFTLPTSGWHESVMKRLAEEETQGPKQLLNERISSSEIIEQKSWKFIRELNSYSEKQLNKTAVIAGDRKYTYRQMFRQWDRYAEVFAGLGITEKNERRVGMVTAADPESVFMLYALNILGVSVSLIDTMDLVDGKSIDKAIEKEGITDLILCDQRTTPGALRRMIALKEKTGLKNVIVYRTQSTGPNMMREFSLLIEMNHWQLRKCREALFMDDLLNQYEGTPFVCSEKENADDAVIVHTSGTTSGIHKPVPLSDRGLNECAARMLRDEQFASMRSRIVSGLAIETSYCYSLVDMLHVPLAFGGTVLIFPMGGYNPKFFPAMEKYKVNTIFMTVYMLDYFKVLYPNLNLSAVQHVFVGGGYVSPETKKQWNEYLAHCGSQARITVGYGLAEIGGACILTDPGREDDAIGRPLSGVKVKIYDEDEDQYYNLEDGPRTGVLFLSSPSLSCGKIGEEEFFKLEEIDGEKYLNTYDLVVVNEDSTMTCVGRMNKYFVNNEGIRFDAGLVETAVAAQPGIDGCVLVPDYDKTLHDTVPVLYVKTGGQPQQAIETVRRALINVFIREGKIVQTNLPGQCAFVTMFPQNTNGKIDIKQIIREDKKDKRYMIQPVRMGGKLVDILLVPAVMGFVGWSGLPDEYDEQPTDFFSRVLPSIEGMKDFDPMAGAAGLKNLKIDFMPIIELFMNYFKDDGQHFKPSSNDQPMALFGKIFEGGYLMVTQVLQSLQQMGPQAFGQMMGTVGQWLMPCWASSFMQGQPAPGGMPQMPGGMPQMPNGMPQMPGGMPQMPDGMPQMPGGMPQMPNGMPQMPGGMPQMPNGMPQMPGGMPQMPGGMPQGAEGMPQMPDGMPQGAEMPQGAKGAPQPSYGPWTMPFGSQSIFSLLSSAYGMAMGMNPQSSPYGPGMGMNPQSSPYGPGMGMNPQSSPYGPGMGMNPQSSPYGPGMGMNPQSSPYGPGMGMNPQSSPYGPGMGMNPQSSPYGPGMGMNPQSSPYGPGMGMNPQSSPYGPGMGMNPQSSPYGPGMGMNPQSSPYGPGMGMNPMSSPYGPGMGMNPMSSPYGPGMGMNPQQAASDTKEAAHQPNQPGYFQTPFDLGIVMDLLAKLFHASTCSSFYEE